MHKIALGAIIAAAAVVVVGCAPTAPTEPAPAPSTPTIEPAVPDTPSPEPTEDQRPRPSPDAETLLKAGADVEEIVAVAGRAPGTPMSAVRAAVDSETIGWRNRESVRDQMRLCRFWPCTAESEARITG